MSGSAAFVIIRSRDTATPDSAVPVTTACNVIAGHDQLDRRAMHALGCVLNELLLVVGVLRVQQMLSKHSH